MKSHFGASRAGNGTAHILDFDTECDRPTTEGDGKE